MKEAVFWALISLLEFEHSEESVNVRPIVVALSKLSVEEIYGFEDLLSEKLYQLDGEKYAREIGSYSYTKGNYFSVDYFLYTRCYVVGKGESFYYKVLNQPKLFPKDIDFEDLLYLPQQAYELKTGKDWIYSSNINYETFSNKKRWKKEELLL